MKARLAVLVSVFLLPLLFLQVSQSAWAENSSGKPKTNRKDAPKIKLMTGAPFIPTTPEQLNNFLTGKGPILEESCGNGVREGNEQCDGGDNCTELCQKIIICDNDGTVEENEECDDGNKTNGDGCNNLCEKETDCGDGIKEGKEDCDPPGPGCDTECKSIPVCGNKTTESGEQCDDGNTASLDGCSSSCQIEPVCGDGVLQKPPEACEFNDQCPLNQVCNNCVCDAAAICGNGTVESPEACETNQNCKSGEVCFNCSCEPDVAARCGDGVTQPPFEQCDDGNLLNQDGCSDTCQRELDEPPPPPANCEIQISGPSSLSVGQSGTVSGTTSCSALDPSNCVSSDQYLWTVSNSIISVNANSGRSMTFTCEQSGATAISVSGSSCSHQTSNTVSVQCNPSPGDTCAAHRLFDDSSQCPAGGCYKQEQFALSNNQTLTCYACEAATPPSNCCPGGAAKAVVSGTPVSGGGCKSTHRCLPSCSAEFTLLPGTAEVQYDCYACTGINLSQCMDGGTARSIGCNGDVSYQPVATQLTDDCTGIDRSTCMAYCRTTDC